MEESTPRHALSDRLKGFAYLTSFDELRQWTEDDVVPVQQSNIPLLPRPDSDHGPPSRSNVMLIHDYRGGYNDYEATQGLRVVKELYSCDYLNYVETFVYFSHKLVTVPPPSWSNACHRHGVKTLGTFIVEPGSTGVEQILETINGRFWVADKLALMAQVYGFEGWLINIERSFPPSAWGLTQLEAFLGQLRTDVGAGGKVVWYDALTTLNVVYYQNTLNNLNLRFASAAGSILTNYAWTPELAERGRQLASETGLGVANVYYGIDVWAQNIQSGRNRRITYPRSGGGGTGTGLGVQQLARLGLSAGIFAPGWSFEHFTSAERAVEKAIWLGEDLPADLKCECNPFRPHEAVLYQWNSISRYAKRFASGSSTFYHTTFGRAFSVLTVADTQPAPHCTDGRMRSYADLSAQSIPSLETRASINAGPNAPVGVISMELPAQGLGCDVFAELYPDRPFEGMAEGELQIAEVNISKCIPQLEIVVTYRATTTEPGRLALSFRGPGCCVPILLDDTNGKTMTKRRRLPLMIMTPIRAIHLSLSCNNAAVMPGRDAALAKIYSITIAPHLRPHYGITDLSIEREKLLDVDHVKILWNITPHPSQCIPATPESPYSSITGPCASFVVLIDGKELGNAYALTYIVPEEALRDLDLDCEILVEVVGVGFDGVEVARHEKRLQLPSEAEDEWEMI